MFLLSEKGSHEPWAVTVADQANATSVVAATMSASVQESFKIQPAVPQAGGASPPQPRNDGTIATLSGLNPNAASFTTPSTTTLCIDASKAVLLGTALADVYDPTSPQSTTPVHGACDIR